MVFQSNLTAGKYRLIHGFSKLQFSGASNHPNQGL